MGSKERRDREKIEMKSLILQTAISQFEKYGYEKLTIRSIANEIEYSPRTIYLYFKDKDELLYAMSVEGFTLFVKYFESVLDIKDPFERLEALCKVYFQFAFENPGYYDLMFVLLGPMNSDINKDSWNIGMKSHSILENVVRDCIESGQIIQGDYKIIAFTIWAHAHGVITFKLRERMKMYDKNERSELINDSSLFMLKLLRK